MKQQINLATKLPQQQCASLQAEKILLIGLIFFLALLVFTLLDYWGNTHLKTSYNILSSKTMLLEQQLKKLQATHPEFFDASYHEKEIALIKGNLQAKQAIVDILKDSKVSLNTAGYSHFLETLAEYTPKAVWLSKIQVSKGSKKISLTGKALSSKDAINYINTLNASEDFSQRPFELAHISQPNASSGTISFILTSTAT